MDIRESLVDWLRRIKYSLDSNKDTVKETNEKLDEVITEVKKDKKVDLSPVNEILKKDKNVTETFITTVDEHEKVLSMTKHFDNDNNLITTKFWDGKVEVAEPLRYLNGVQLSPGEKHEFIPYVANHIITEKGISIEKAKAVRVTCLEGSVVIKTFDYNNTIGGDNVKLTADGLNTYYVELEKPEIYITIFISQDNSKVLVTEVGYKEVTAKNEVDTFQIN